MKNQFFFVDAETDGLYGSFLSVAALVTDAAGAQLDSFYGAVRVKYDDISSEWVKENVFPYLSNAHEFFDDEKSLLEAFWAFWMKHRETSECVAYVQYPVECRLFSTCVMHNLSEREFLAPFPIYDLSTLLTVYGFGFDCDMQALSEMNISSHDAMNDVKMMAKVWHKLQKL